MSLYLLAKAKCLLSHFLTFYFNDRPIRCQPFQEIASGEEMNPSPRAIKCKEMRAVISL